VPDKLPHVSEPTVDPDDAPGWHAIDTALGGLYGDATPQHYAAVPHYALGGQDPLDGISYYANDNPSHWHAVTYGLSELYESDDPGAEVSGWGFELTFRLERDPSEEKPPGWSWNFLQNLARYVFKSRHLFGVHHQMDLRGPIDHGQPTPIVAIAFEHDPRLPAINTPNGRLEFLQVVGITADESHAIEAWNAKGILDLMRQRDPLLLTRLQRPSFLEDPSFAEAVDAGRQREGSSQWGLFVSVLDWSIGEEAEVVLGASVVDSLLRMIPGRLPFGREVTLAGSTKSVRLRPASAAGFTAADDRLLVDCPEGFCEEVVNTLKAQRGVYRFPSLPRLQFRVLPSEITDADGKVVKVIG
jgi:suppressor of fused-like protein